jgi:hypothetical protein
MSAAAASRFRQRHAVHSAQLHAIAPHQVIRRGMPLDRIGSYHDALTRRFNLPVYARHPHPAANGAGPSAIAASDVVTHDERGFAHVVDSGGLFAIDELVLPPGMTVHDGQMIGCVRVIDPYQPER